MPRRLPGARCALTAPFHPCHARLSAPFGGLFSVALSRGSPRPVVNRHPALWCSDFPRRPPLLQDRRVRPSGSGAVRVTRGMGGGNGTASASESGRAAPRRAGPEARTMARVNVSVVRVSDAASRRIAASAGIAPAARATLLRVLGDNVLCAIATVSTGGRPHVSTAYFCVSPALELYFLSHPRSLHCRNLAARPTAAIAVFSSSQGWRTRSRPAALRDVRARDRTARERGRAPLRRAVPALRRVAIGPLPGRGRERVPVLPVRDAEAEAPRRGDLG